MKMKEEKGESPKSTKWFRQTMFCIFCQQKNQSWHLSSRVICTQDRWWLCEKKRGYSPGMCHPSVALRKLPVFLRGSGGHHNVMSLSFTQWRKKVVMCPSTQKRQMHWLFQGIQSSDTMLLPSTKHLLLNTRQIFNSSLEHHNWRRTSLSKHVLTCLASLTEVAVNPASR